MKYPLAIAFVMASSSVTIADNVAETFFPFDSAELDADATSALDAASEQIADMPKGVTVVLAAHADEIGTEAYNVGLTARRAEAVRDALVERGISSDRIVLALYGEDGPRRDRFAEDRRVTISMTASPLYSIVDARLEDGPATALVWAEPVTLAELEGPDSEIDQTARR